MCALARLRHRFYSRPLWIDAICIDQAKDKASEEERIVQIQLIGEVYRMACCVRVWLGDGPSLPNTVVGILWTASIVKSMARKIPSYMLGGSQV